MNFKAQFDELLNKCVTTNASGRKCFSLAMLTDDDIRWMAEECPSWDYLTDVTDDGGNNLYQIAAEKGFAPKDSDDEEQARVWFAVCDPDHDAWDYGSFDRREAEQMAWDRIDQGYEGVQIAVIANDFCQDAIFPEDFRTPHVIGTWWNDSSIQIVEIDGDLYALNGWNGEKYTDCFRVIDRFTAADDDRKYEIRPIYFWSDFDEDSEEFRDQNGNIYDGIGGYEIV